MCLKKKKFKTNFRGKKERSTDSGVCQKKKPCVYIQKHSNIYDKIAFKKKIK